MHVRFTILIDHRRYCCLYVVNLERVGVGPGVVVDLESLVVDDEGVAGGDDQVVVPVQLVKLHPDHWVVPRILQHK